MISALLDHLWQSSLFSGGAGLLTLMLRRHGAYLRFWLWSAASFKFLLPFSLLTAMGSLLPSTIAPVPTLSVIQPVTQPFSGPAPMLRAAASVSDVVPWLLVLWAVGFIVIVCRWLAGWIQLRRVLRAATDLPIAAPLTVKMSTSMLEPGLVGFRKPVILLPAGIGQKLSTAELDAILAHELCHARRRDNLLSAIHMLVEALFWFYPLVWWLGSRLNIERERACDESVLASGCAAPVYAESILKVCKHYVRSPLACAAGVSGADLKMRIEMIVTGPLALQLGPVKRLLLFSCAAVALLAPVAAGMAKLPIASTSPFASDTVLRRYIEEMRQGMPRYNQMSPALAEATRRQYFAIQQYLGRWGALIDLRFSHIDAKGFDVYDASFAHGRGEWRISVMPDGDIKGLNFHDIPNPTGAPRPGTQDSLRRYIASLQAGSPDYEDMTPDLAAVVHRQLPLLLPVILKWGPLKSVSFLGRDVNDMDVYRAAFANGVAEWRIAPLMPDGKVRSRNVRVLD